ncbi:MAG: VOC family protein [Solirubrobacteraceae bacterium]
MTVETDAVLEDDDGRTALRFERLLEHPPEQVWLALTEPDELRHWHPSPFQAELRVGGAVSFLSPGGIAFGEGTVTACDPPRLLAYTWGEDELRWELVTDGDGTRLTLTHTFDDRLKAARDAAGWHLCLEALAGSMAAGDTAAPPSKPATPARWAEVNSAYEQAFGIAPDEATPPPSRIDALAPLLMFEGDAEEAMRFYASIFFPSRIGSIERYGPGEDGEGTVRHARLRLGDSVIEVIDSPIEHAFGFTPAVSLTVRAASAREVDAIYARLSEEGKILMPLNRYPFSERFGWVTDRFGVSWQVSLE